MRKSVFRVIIIALGIVALTTIGILWYKEWNAKKDFLTPMPELTATLEPTATNTPTPEPTATNTPTPEPTATNTPTPEPTATNTPTPEPTATNTPTPKPTATNTPTPKPTATNTPTPTPVVLPYTKDGKIYMDQREDPNCVNSYLFIPSKRSGADEYIAMWREMNKYADYLPVIGEISTYFPLFPNDIMTGKLYDGGVYYIKANAEREKDLMWNLIELACVIEGDGGLCGNLNSNTDLPHENGVNYVGCLWGGQMYVVRYYVYYVD